MSQDHAAAVKRLYTELNSVELNQTFFIPFGVPLFSNSQGAQSLGARQTGDPAVPPSTVLWGLGKGGEIGAVGKPTRDIDPALGAEKGF